MGLNTSIKKTGEKEPEVVCYENKIQFVQKQYYSTDQLSSDVL